MHQKLNPNDFLSVKTEEITQTVQKMEDQTTKKGRKKLRNLFSQVCAVNTVVSATQPLMEKHLNSPLKDPM